MKAIITKYALTSGVKVLEGKEHPKERMFEHLTSSGYRWYLHGNDWHKNKQSALSWLAVMRKKKEASLKKQLSELEAKHAKAILAIEASDLP
jgi:hypothetical protein